MNIVVKKYIYSVIFNIIEENIIKILKMEKNVNIEYQKVSIKQHICDINEKSINIKEVKTSSEDYTLATEKLKITWINSIFKIYKIIKLQ